MTVMVNVESKIAPTDSDNITCLRLLHPQGATLQASLRAQPPFGDHELTTKQVLREQRSFKSMAGPSALRNTHLFEATDTPSPADKNRIKNLLSVSYRTAPPATCPLGVPQTHRRPAYFTVEAVRRTKAPLLSRMLDQISTLEV